MLTGKQPFSANQSIYQLSDKGLSVPDDIVLQRSIVSSIRKHASSPGSTLLDKDKNNNLRTEIHHYKGLTHGKPLNRYFYKQ